MATWLAILNALCTLLPFIAFASPATVFIPVLFEANNSHQQQQVHNVVIEMPPLALTTQMLQCFLFAIYAYHFQMWTLLIPNVAGFSLGFLWSTIYPFKVAPDDGLKLQWRVKYTISISLMVVGLLTIKRLPYLSSTIAAGVGVLMCTYPLPSMHQAYREKNSNLMGSAAMNMAMFITCFAWVIHSSWLVEYDIFVMVSNFAGVVVQGGAIIMRIVISRTRRAEQGDDAELSALSTLL